MYLDMGIKNMKEEEKLEREDVEFIWSIGTYILREKIKKNSRKNGPRFSFTDDSKDIRKKIETFFTWVQSFWSIRFSRERTHCFIP